MSTKHESSASLDATSKGNQTHASSAKGEFMYKVNNTSITEEDVGREMQYHPAETQEKAAVLATESLIIAELFKQRAQSLKIDIDEQETFVEKLIEQEVTYPQASTKDCENYYTQNKKKFRSSPLLEVSHILLAAAPDDVEGRSQANEVAEKLLSELKQDSSKFAALAKSHSRCPSAETGGNLGQISCGQTVPEFERQLFNCGVGLVETPIESRYGVHVIYINRKEDARQLPYDQVAERISDYLNAKVRNTAIAQYIATLIDAAEVQGFEFDTENRQFYH